jgi:hypothetical protein
MSFFGDSANFFRIKIIFIFYAEKICAVTLLRCRPSGLGLHGEHRSPPLPLSIFVPPLSDF